MGLVAVAVELLVAWQWPGGACLEEEEEVEEEVEDQGLLFEAGPVSLPPLLAMPLDQASARPPSPHRGCSLLVWGSDQELQQHDVTFLAIRPLYRSRPCS